MSQELENPGLPGQTEAPSEAPGEASSDPPPAPKKRNCGRSGPTTAAGRAKSALNATKHGSCAWTLILPTESEEGFCLLLDRFLDLYQPEEDTLTYDYVLKAAQAEWHRIRAEGNYNSFLATTSGIAPYNWKPEQVKQHDLMLRYKTTTERSFQRANAALEQHYKIHKPKPTSQPDPNPASQPSPDPEPKHVARTKMLVPDPNSPTGYSYTWEFPPRPGVTYPCPAPPPPIPEIWKQGGRE